MNRLSLVISFFIGPISLLQAQSVVIVTTDQAVDLSLPEMVHVEPHLAINPTDPNHLVAASIVLDTAFNEWSSAAFTSFDGGQSWLRHNFKMERCIDPWVTINGDGSVFMTAIEILRGVKNDRRFNLLLFNSEDGGLTWNGNKNSLGRGFDHEMMVPSGEEGSYWLLARKARDLDADSSMYDFHLAGSKDRGQSFGKGKLFKPDVESRFITPTGMEIIDQQTQVISFIEFPSFETKSLLLVGGIPGTPTTISNPCGDCTSFPGYPALAMDKAGTYFYHACIGEEFDGVWFSRSMDKAKSWGPAIRLDQLPEKGTAHVRTVMVEVDAVGTIGVAWYDRRNDAENECQDIYFTASADNGLTFTERVRISTETSCPNAPGNGDTFRSWPGGGDYGALVSDPNGLYHIIWSDSRTGTAQLRHSVLRVED